MKACRTQQLNLSLQAEQPRLMAWLLKVPGSGSRHHVSQSEKPWRWFDRPVLSLPKGSPRTGISVRPEPVEGSRLNCPEVFGWALRRPLRPSLTDILGLPALQDWSRQRRTIYKLAF